MPPIRRSSRFLADVAETAAWLWIESSKRTSDQFLESVDATLRDIAEHPRIGRPYRSRRGDLRGIRVIPVRNQFRNWLVFYVSDEGEVTALAVIHGARDIESALTDE